MRQRYTSVGLLMFWLAVLVRDKKWIYLNYILICLVLLKIYFNYIILHIYVIFIYFSILSYVVFLMFVERHAVQKT